MPYIYNSGAQLSASASANLQPIAVPPVNRYLYPWGLDLSAVSVTGNQSRHTAVPAIQFIPLKVASTITIDRIGMMINDANGCTDTWTYDLGLYTHNSADNYPSTKITDFGTITYEPGVTSDGVQLITINQELLGNTTYWLAIGINVDGEDDINAGRTPWVNQLQGDFAMFRKRGIPNAGAGSYGMNWLHSIFSYAGTLPDTVAYANNSASGPTAIRTPMRRSA